jgi:hypothetical protein
MEGGCWWIFRIFDGFPWVSHRLFRLLRKMWQW